MTLLRYFALPNYVYIPKWSTCIVSIIWSYSLKSLGPSLLWVPAPALCLSRKQMPGRGKVGIGESWNSKIWHNKSVPIYAVFPGVIVSALGAPISISPNSLSEMAATIQKPRRNTTTDP